MAYSDRYYKNLYRQQQMPNVSLAMAGLTPATFNPLIYTPEKRDISILQRSLATLDERKEKTDAQRSAIRLALGQAKLNAAEDAWKADYTNNIINKIDEAAQFGDYSAALETATDLASKSISDPAFTSRIRANEEYEKAKAVQQDRLAKGEIGQNTYNWWLRNNPYKFEEKRDANGNVVGGDLSMTTAAPVADINWANQAMMAFKLLTPNRVNRSTDGSTSVTNNAPGELDRGGKSYKSGESISGSSHSTDNREWVSVDDIRANIEELIGATPDGYRQVEQAFNVAYDDYTNLQKEYERLLVEKPDSQETINIGQQLDARKKLMERNGSPIDYKEYYARMVTDNLFAQGMAYDWRTTASGGSSSYSIGVPGGSRVSGGGGYTDKNNPTYTKQQGVTWNGAYTRQKTNLNQAEGEANTAGSNIVERMK